jgi:hypothetical protein
MYYMQNGKRVQVPIPSSQNNTQITHASKKSKNGCSSCGKPATWLIILLSIVAVIVFAGIIYAILRRSTR